MKEQNESLIEKLKTTARKLKSDTQVLYLAYKHPYTPWYAKIFTGLVIAYAFSPIDLVPDFIPVLGYLDDLILVPLGIALAVKMIPISVMEECRRQVEMAAWEGKPTNWVSAVIIVLIWLILGTVLIRWLAGILQSG